MRDVQKFRDRLMDDVQNSEKNKKFKERTTEVGVNCAPTAGVNFLVHTFGQTCAPKKLTVASRPIYRSDFKDVR